MLWTKIVTTSDRGRPSRSPPESQPQSSPSTHLASDDAVLANPVRRHARILLRLAPAIAPGSAVFSASGRSGSSSFPRLPWVRSRSPSHPLNPARHRPDHRRPWSRDSEPLPPCSRCSSKSAPSIQAVWKGSEYPAVVIPVLTQHYAMLKRNLLYTGVTRGKRLVALVSQKKAVAIAVCNASERLRWSKTDECLAGETQRGMNCRGDRQRRDSFFRQSV